jgi:hypothetical protein
MKLKKFENERRFKRGVPSVYLSKKGLVNFSSEFVRQTGLETGQKVNFYQDEKEPGDWYIQTDPQGDFELYQVPEQKSLKLNSVALCEAITKSVGRELPTTFKMAVEPTEPGLYAILTAIKI